MNKESKATILVVDDTPANIDVIKGILSDNYTVQAAISGKVALKIVERKPPDLVLLDLMMPEMDGYEVIKRLKAQEHTKHIPVIFVSAKGDDLDQVKVIACGAEEYLNKPVNPQKLLASVEKYI